MKMLCKYCGIVEKPHICYKNRTINDKNREDKRIYKTYEWQRKRKNILNKFNHICLWSFFTEGKIVVANNVHHIIEITEDNTKAFDDENLIPVCEDAHKIIHELYKTDKFKTQEMLRKFIKKYEEKMS